MSSLFVDGVTPFNAANMNKLIPFPGGAVVNGQWLKGSGGAVVWAAITAADVSNLSTITSPVVSGANTDIPAPTSTEHWYNMQTGGGTVRSIGTPPANGARVVLTNGSVANITIKNQLAGGSGLQLFTRGRVDVVLVPQESAEFVYDSVEWVEVNRDFAVPRITASTLAGGPPASPSDGDIWIATAVDTVGTNWMFRYNAGSGSAYKWEFIGGSPMYLSVGAAQSLAASAGIQDLATVGPSFTLTRVGDYIIRWGILTTSGAASGATPNAGAVITQGGGARIGNMEATCEAVGSAAQTGMASSRETMTLNPSAELRVRYYNNNGNPVTFQNRWLECVPVRVS
jgi:hypothetical protein